MTRVIVGTAGRADNSDDIEFCIGGRYFRALAADVPALLDGYDTILYAGDPASADPIGDACASASGRMILGASRAGLGFVVTVPGGGPESVDAAEWMVPRDHLRAHYHRHDEPIEVLGLSRYPCIEWPYCDEYTIAPVPFTTGYQGHLIVPWQEGMQTDFSDLRFRDPVAGRCPYRVENIVAEQTADVWIRLRRYQTRLDVLYGNPAATTESDGAAVFEFWDDFPGSSLDLTRWNKESYATAIVSGGILTATGNGVRNNTVVSSKMIFGTNRAVRIRAKFYSGSFSSACYGWRPAIGSSDVGFAGAYNTNGYRHCTYVSAYERDGQNNDANWHTLDVARNGSDSVVFTRDGSTVFTATHQIPTGSIPVGVKPYGSSPQNVQVDWIAVRQYQSPEPAFTLAASGPNPWGDG